MLTPHGDVQLFQYHSVKQVKKGYLPLLNATQIIETINKFYDKRSTKNKLDIIQKRNLHRGFTYSVKYHDLKDEEFDSELVDVLWEVLKISI